jgi:hypothetical protein
MIIALAGRRIDASDADVPRFPLQNVDLVRARLRTAFETFAADTLACSASCGSDLLALSVAGELGMRRRIILPYDRDRFRRTSVTDRPGDWGRLFDEVCADADATGSLITLDSASTDDKAYIATNTRILEEVVALVRSDTDKHVDSDKRRITSGYALAVVVWEGETRGDDDLTAAFADLARDLGLSIVEILTK